MKKRTIYIIIAVGLFFHSCKNEIVQFLPGGERKAGSWFEPIPYGMAYIPRGSYVIGPSDDEAKTFNEKSKRVTVESFWMDDTEITNNEYRQFVYWVRDSITRNMLGQTFPEYLITETKQGVPLDVPVIDWNEKINWRNPEYLAAIKDLYIPEEERMLFSREIDSRKLVYEYSWVDYKQAARRINSYDTEHLRYNGTVVNSKGETIPVTNRSNFLMHETVPVYPDTLCWIRDFTYSYNEPFTLKYFSHVAFDDYPVVGVTWKQARAFCNWRTKIQTEHSGRIQEAPAHDYRLPTETEWELAARGGLNDAIYPWGSYYSRSEKGCFVANFKPLRGNYVSDSPSTTVAMKTGQFDPNNYGLYDMAGNVAEWTSSAYYEAAYDIISDFNPEMEYDARPDDPPVMKRKVIRGGSWKDIAYFIRTSTRTFEYQDTAKSYIGFRCVRSSFRDELRNR